MAANSMAAWFETHGVAVLLTMRVWHALILRSGLLAASRRMKRNEHLAVSFETRAKARSSG
jgi:hypothetical protein